MTRPGPKELLARLAYELGTAAGSSTSIVLPLARRRGHGVVVDPATALVVEGFPRSGSSLAVAAISTAQPAPVGIAHHLHAPAHVLAAMSLGVPALVVVRRPRDAVVDLVIAKPFLTVGQALRGYRRFHAPLAGSVERFTVATWEQVHEDVGAVVERLDRRSGATLAAPGPGNDEELQATIGAQWAGRQGPGLPLVGRSPQRDASPAGEEVARGRLRAAYGSPALRDARDRAERLYAIFAEHAGEVS